MPISAYQKSTPLPRKAFRVPEVAASLGLSRAQVYAMCASGELDSVRTGRSVVVPAEAIDAWLKQNNQEKAS